MAGQRVYSKFQFQAGLFPCNRCLCYKSHLESLINIEAVSIHENSDPGDKAYKLIYFTRKHHNSISKIKPIGATNMTTNSGHEHEFYAICNKISQTILLQ